VSAEVFVHPTAIVEDGAEIGTGSRVWHHAHLRKGARIGERSVLGKNVFVDQDVSIGSGVKIQNNVSVYLGVTIEDDVFVGPSAVFTNDRVPRAHAEDWQLVPTVVRTGASVGANATIVCGVELGEHCMVGAGAIVTRDVEPHELVVGTPARRIGWVCRCGTILHRGDEAPTVLECADCRGEGA
jgi:acetyltransferase-like isoleucine patch superfamily enzyme